MAKYSYILEARTYNSFLQQYTLSDLEPFTSEEKMREYIDTRLRINKGTNIEWGEKEVSLYHKEEWSQLLHYNFPCYGEDKMGKARYILHRQLVNKNT